MGSPRQLVEGVNASEPNGQQFAAQEPGRILMSAFEVTPLCYLRLPSGRLQLLFRDETSPNRQDNCDERRGN